MNIRQVTPVALVAIGLAATVSYWQIDHSNNSDQPLMPERVMDKLGKGPKPYDKPKEATQFYLEKRLPFGETVLPVEKYQNAKVRIDSMSRYESAKQKVLMSNDLKKQQNPSAYFKGLNTELGDWENIGPGNIGGRTRTIIIDPTEPETMYIAGVAGGVWKTTNGGEEWTPLSDLMANIAVVSLSFDPQDSKTIYAGTGEGYFNGDAVRGNGIFVSKNSGVTWSQLTSTGDNSDFYYVNKVVVSPNDSDVLYAATSKGIFQSKDAGKQWSHVYDSAGTYVGCTDLAIRTDKTVDHLIASCGSFVPSSIISTKDAGTTWSTVLSDNSMGRSTLAIAPSNQDIIYVLNASSSVEPQNMRANGVNAIFRSDDGGDTWATQFSVNASSEINSGKTVATAGGFGISLLTNTYYGMLPTCGYLGATQYLNQGWYDSIISVDPKNPDIVWAGGIDLFRSDDAGQTWGLTSFWWKDTSDKYYAHADQHIHAFHPSFDGETNKTLFVGNDGGIQKTIDARASTLNVEQYCDFIYGRAELPESGNVEWEGLNNGYAVTQFYNGAASSDGQLYIAGAQDNGTNKGTDELGVNAWTEISGGDGGYVAIDPNDPNIMFGEYTGLSLQKSVNGGASWSSATNGINGGGFPFITTFKMDKNNSQRLWILGSQIWRTDDQGANWVQASTSASDNSTGRSVAIANTNSDHVMVGTNSGLILRTTTAGANNSTTSWQETLLTNGFVSSIAYDPTDESIAYATVSTFGVPHVWKTIDGGATWLAIDNQSSDNGLPDIPAHSVVVDPSDNQRVFVGTDLGVFVTTDGGDTWLVENGGFANTPTETLTFVGRKLFAFTHGRGAYRVDLNDLSRVDELLVELDEDTEKTVNKNLLLEKVSDRPTNNLSIDIVEITELPAKGTLSVNDDELSVGDKLTLADFQEFKYTPNEDKNGRDQFKWKGYEGEEQSSREGVVSFDIAPVNDAPYVRKEIPAQSITKGAEYFLNIDQYIWDVDRDRLTYSSTNMPAGLTLSVHGVVTGEATETFSDNVSVTVTDGELSVDTTFKLTVKKKKGGSMNLVILALLGLYLGRRFVRK